MKEHSDTQVQATAQDEVRVPGSKNRSPGKWVGGCRKQADSCPRHRRLLVLRRVGEESRWAPCATALPGSRLLRLPPPPIRLPCPWLFSPQPLWPLFIQPPVPVPPRPDSPTLAKPDRGWGTVFSDLFSRRLLTGDESPPALQKLTIQILLRWGFAHVLSAGTSPWALPSTAEEGPHWQIQNACEGNGGLLVIFLSACGSTDEDT